MLKTKHISKQDSRRGQSFVELMLVVLLLALLLAGVVEFGFLINQYMHLMDAARESARFSSSSSPFRPDGSMEPVFYEIAAQVATNVMDPIALDPARDDVVISVFTVSGTSITRFPDADGWSLYGNRASRFTSAEVMSRIPGTAPGAGVLVVEVFYSYDHVLDLPVFSDIVPNPIQVHSYTIMPISAAEPTSTPGP
ncbi:MAG: TadE/TadG family type IV pilus assembly protein [Chloroflexota bacterium]